jgi:hypothetical protein
VHGDAILWRAIPRPSTLMNQILDFNREAVPIGCGKGRASNLDCVQGRYSGKNVDVIFHGHSIGAGVAFYATAHHSPTRNVYIRGIILETPFTSVADMLVTLYPHKLLFIDT